MAMQERAFGHLADDLPQFALLQSLLGQHEHHAGVNVALAFREAVFIFFRPQLLLLHNAYLVDDLAGFSGHR